MTQGLSYIQMAGLLRRILHLALISIMVKIMKLTLVMSYLLITRIHILVHLMNFKNGKNTLQYANILMEQKDYPMVQEHLSRADFSHCLN